MRKRFRDIRNHKSVTEEAPVNSTGASVSGTEGTVVVKKSKIPMLIRRKIPNREEQSE